MDRCHAIRAFKGRLQPSAYQWMAKDPPEQAMLREVEQSGDGVLGHCGLVLVIELVQVQVDLLGLQGAYISLH